MLCYRLHFCMWGHTMLLLLWWAWCRLSILNFWLCERDLIMPLGWISVIRRIYQIFIHTDNEAFVHFCKMHFWECIVFCSQPVIDELWAHRSLIQLIIAVWLLVKEKFDFDRSLTGIGQNVLCLIGRIILIVSHTVNYRDKTSHSHIPLVTCVSAHKS